MGIIKKMMSESEPVNVRELTEYCLSTDESCDVLVYINNVAIGFIPDEISYDFDGSIRLHIKDPIIQIKD